jgi:N,N'-diacetylchitobiose transport system permease protein
MALTIRRRHARRLGYDLLGVLVFAAMIFPVYWMVSTAFKPGRDILRFDPKLLPAPFTLANFADAVA